MADARYCVEYAKTGRSSCKKCKSQIEKGVSRIGKITPNPFSDDGGEMKVWYHTRCMFETLKVRVKFGGKKKLEIYHVHSSVTSIAQTLLIQQLDYPCYGLELEQCTGMQMCRGGISGIRRCGSRHFCWLEIAKLIIWHTYIQVVLKARHPSGSQG